MKRFLHLLLAAIAANAASPPVQVSLKSSWPAPSSLVELLETFALEDAESFYPLLDLLTNREVLPSVNLSPEGLHQATVEIAKSNKLLEQSGSLESVEMNLAMHAATPKIEAFYTYYETHHSASEGRNCGSWVDWYGDVVCDVEKLASLAGVETLDSSETHGPKTLTFDHIHPSSELLVERPKRTAILYASLTSPNFRELHEYLYKLSNKPNPHVEYVLRHLPPTGRAGQGSTLSGFGVGLDLKKMDYLALDDRLSKSAGKAQQKNTAASEDAVVVDPIMQLIEAYPENTTASDAKGLTKEEFLELGPQAVQLIADSENPLETFIALSQNFPKYATSIPRRVVANESITKELHENGLKVQPGMNVMWINGGMLDGKETEPLGLLRQIKKERAIMRSLASLGLSRAQAIEVLTHSNITAAQRGGSVLDGLFDASDRQEGGGLIVYWNDVHKDQRYAHFSNSLYTLLRPTFPGQFPSVKANLFNVVLALDLSQTASLNFITGPMSNILERRLPFRFGVVPIAETENGIKMARLFYHLINVFGRKKTLEFLTKVSPTEGPMAVRGESVHWPSIEDAYDQLMEAELSENPDTPKVTFYTVLKGEAPAGAPVEKLAAYHERLGTTLSQSRTGHAFFNGKPSVFDSQFLRSLQSDFGTFQQYYQESIYNGIITDAQMAELGDHFYDLPTTGKRRSVYIFPKTPADLQIANVPEALSNANLKLQTGSYLYTNAEAVPLSIYVVGDFDSEAGLSLASEALDSLTEASEARVSFIANPKFVEKFGPESPSTLLSFLVKQGTLQNWSSKGAVAVLKSALGIFATATDDNSDQAPLSQKAALEHVTAGLEFNEKDYADYIVSARLFLKQLKIVPGQLAVIVNGRIVSPITPGTFKAGDFEALGGFELRKRTEPVIAALKDVVPELIEDKLQFAELASLASSIIAKIQQPDPSESGLFDSGAKPRHRNYNLLDSEYSSFEYGDNTTALYHVAVIVDPLSESGQKWSSLLKWLSNIPDIFIKVYLNPGPYTDLPLKRFYRYNLLPSLSYDVDGQEIPSEIAFQGLPIDPIYTLAMDVPSSWLVRPRESLYDLDNIQLGQLLAQDNSVTAIFSLDALILDGHARDASTQAPPRGVQLQLTTPTPEGATVPIQDTLVVANLGYFQFRVAPGVFGLEIREGRGRKIFDMVSVGGQGWDSPGVEETGVEVALTSFEGVTLYPRLKRKSGMEREDVLAQSGDNGGVLDNITSKISGIFKGKKTTESGVVPAKKQADINIFTVASGLLYERFASIMILSVLRNTKHTVKFWFIENFLSPSFLEFIPHMAAEYGFDYELVTYKWPSWLRAQTEKQRIIWAYKILFLDVLFPMDLKKVIFVDADQIVRADLKELVDLDLHGAPYGYTPMGDDNHEMEGFRFWKTGYWKNFLEGKPYHISALYVIDLVKFRQMAAGDILRQQYQALSADPNSLANLDQDLPNNLQNQVPIHSLHEDWLWKEPKLSRARQIPEWEVYDTEIANLTRRLAEQGKIHSGLSTADTNVLAGGPSDKKSGDGEPVPTQGESSAGSENSDGERPRDEL
ncbi:hypothetical protein EST38_g7933 [Candolleomyces aberdarensis]|uniref:UDP-glucose:glycoprotein glucosyltransferase n=1 Tax=Candolleomyces aberdarensis TaxID=2316362 RepID=A0A4Q2DFX8_9AGAR|nr:hypothetical protein EST38_g7933 [Candolleomyces aberdarensis]